MTSTGALYDNDLYSRQVFALGERAMCAITQTNVIISGMNGLGVEIGTVSYIASTFY